LVGGRCRFATKDLLHEFLVPVVIKSWHGNLYAPLAYQRQKLCSPLHK
jgi:hypothetical protein